MSLLDQANNPRRLVAHDDDSVVHSCTYPCATLLGGIPWWIQSDRLSHPLHSLEGQSRPWGVCITPASGGEELHLYSSQVIKDLGGPDPSSLTGSVISRERIAASCCTWLSHAPSTINESDSHRRLSLSLDVPRSSLPARLRGETAVGLPGSCHLPFYRAVRLDPAGVSCIPGL